MQLNQSKAATQRRAPEKGNLNIPAVDREVMSRPNVFEIDLSAVAHNTAAVRALLGPSVKLFAALKANAYGFGLVEVAKTVLSSGAEALSLADLSDALRLRAQGISAPILLYPGNLATAEVARAIERNRIYPTILDLESARIYSSHFRGDSPVFVKVDVGLERLGVAPETAVQFVRSVADLPRLRVHGLYTHMHIIDGARAETYATWQYDRFVAILAALTAAGMRPVVQMAASSAVLRMTTAMNLNAADPGHLIYGLRQPGPDLVKLDLRPAFRKLRTRLIQVKGLHRSDWIAEAPFPVDRVVRTGVLPIGRADGMSALNSGQVLVRGTRVPVLGRPSTEHTRVDLSGVPDAKLGDEVVIIGRQGDDEITIDEVLEYQHTPLAVAVALEVRASVLRRYVSSAGMS